MCCYSSFFVKELVSRIYFCICLNYAGTAAEFKQLIFFSNWKLGNFDFFFCTNLIETWKIKDRKPRKIKYRGIFLNQKKPYIYVLYSTAIYIFIFLQLLTSYSIYIYYIWIFNIYIYIYIWLQTSSTLGIGLGSHKWVIYDIYDAQCIIGRPYVGSPQYRGRLQSTFSYM